MVIKFYSDIEVKFKDEEDLTKKGVIYCLNFENGKTYIGQTTGMLRSRIANHCRIANSCTKLKNAIQKYKTFTVSILESNLTLSQLNSFEAFYIKLFNSNGDDGYNLESGGMNKIVSDETKCKMSVSQKNISDETRRKMSESQKGHKNNLGKTHSDETKCKMSESHKNMSDETRRKMSESHKGFKLSDEARRKRIESQRKKVKSIPDNIIFNSLLDAKKYYNISHIEIYYNGKIHRRSGQTFVLL